MVYPAYGGGSERMNVRPNVEPVKETGTKFDAKFPANGNTREAADYLWPLFLKLDDLRPSLMDFKSIPEDQRREDSMQAAKLKREYRTQGTVEGRTLELVLPGIIAQNNWFGGEISPTTEYDDYFNGTDAVLEIGKGKLLVDITSAELPERVKAKLGKLVHGGTVKYFKSKVEKDEKGAPKEISLYNAPMVILGIDTKFLPYIAGVMKQEEDAKRKARMMGKTRPPSNPFENNPLQLLLLEQMSFQVGIQLRDTAIRLLNIENTIGDKEAAGVLSELRKRFNEGGVSAEEVIQLVDRITSALAEYQQKNKGNLAVVSNVMIVSKWENIAVVYQAITAKKAEVEAKKNADQIMAARGWRAASVTHRLLTTRVA